MPRKVLAALLLSVTACALVLAPRAARGQGIITGTISGTVTDPSGAVVPKAQITATSVTQGAQRNTVSNAAGDFAIFAVPIGIYTVEISAPGFSTATVNSVRVDAGAASALKTITLSPAKVSTVVYVNGSMAALLQTTDSQVTTSFSSQEVQNIPLNNGFDTLTEVIPGVASAHGADFANENGDNFSVNAQNGRFNNFELDGQSNNDNSVGGPQLFFGSQEAIAQIQVITGNYSAQYGRDAGGIVNYITKSGTNQFHGSGFEFYQGDMLASMTNFDKNPLFGFCAPGEKPATTFCTEPVVPRYVESRYGGVIGGPVIKDKLFFFGSTYWDKVFTGAVPFSTLPLVTPTPAGISDLESAFPGNNAVSGIARYGPYSLATGNPTPTSTPICPTTAPAGGLPPGCKAETGPNGVTVVIPDTGVDRSLATDFADQEELGRIDWSPNSKDRFFLRYFYQNEVTYNDDLFNTAAGQFLNIPATVQSVGGDWTRAFSPNWVNQIRYSFQQEKVGFEGGAYPKCVTTNLMGCPTFVAFDSGEAAFGVNPDFPQGRTVKVTQIQDNATWTHGNQTILFGGELDMQNSPDVFLPFYNGFYLYPNFSSFLADSGQLSLAAGNPVIPFTETDAAGYFQDDWKVTPSFTAHLGMRWEFFGQAVNKLHDETVVRESNPATAFFNTSLPLADRTVPGVAQVYTNFEPRIGFAWNPEFDRKLVVTGGYAINDSLQYYNIFLVDAISTPVALSETLTCSGRCLPPGGAFTGAGVRAVNASSLLFGGNPEFSNQTYVPQNFRTPYVQTYTLGIRRQIGHAAVAKVRYVGSKSTDNFQSIDANPYLAPVAAAFPGVVSPSSLCSTPGAPGVGRPNCNRSNYSLVSNGGWANYQGLEFNVTTQNLHGLTGTFSYTYSREIDNVTDAFASSSGAGISNEFAENPQNTDQGERGVDGYSYPNVIGLGMVYTVPNPVHSSGWLSRIVNGFNLSGIYRYTSGQPFNAVQPLFLDGNTGDTSFCDFAFNSSSVGPGTDTCRMALSNPKAPAGSVAYLNPYVAGAVSATTGLPPTGPPAYVTYGTDSVSASGIYSPGAPINPSSAHWIVNNQAYALSVNNPYPGVGRNDLRGQGFSDLDLSLFKTIPITHGVAAQVSISAYNSLNQMYRNPPIPFLDEYSASGYNAFLSNGEQISDSIPGNTAGNRIVIIGGKIIF